MERDAVLHEDDTTLKVCAMSFLPRCAWREDTSVLALPLNTIEYIMVVHLES